MPKKHKNRTMKGGFWNSLTQGFSDAWEKTKKATTDAYSSATGSPTTSTYSPTTTTTYSPTTTSTYSPTTTSTTTSTGYMGGKTKRRRMRGGFKDNAPTSGLANNAATFSGQTAQPHNWVGGKTKRRKHRNRHRHNKSSRHRR
jgi:hypothetical protein